ncbi:MAG TPA: response regulator transcription factor [Streptosporangiaceae bacterium]|nr:response regulator transcription factor [Streptosporangiaceae bacterium]
MGDRVLAIDDEPGVLRLIARALRNEGIEADTATNGEDGLRLALRGSYDVVILDLLMPGTDGLSVLRRLMRLRPGQGLIVVSCLTDTASKVRCLEMGADDYLPKPFVLDELLARIKVRIRAKNAPNPHVLTTPRIVLDPVRQEADAGHGYVRLTRRESMLLAELMQHAGSTVSKERLLSSVWGYSFHPESNVVDVYVRRLRTKLEQDVIATVRGVGYRVDID